MVTSDAGSNIAYRLPDPSSLLVATAIFCISVIMYHTVFVHAGKVIENVYERKRESCDIKNIKW
jgi:hypothetical protein